MVYRYKENQSWAIFLGREGEYGRKSWDQNSTRWRLEVGPGVERFEVRKSRWVLWSGGSLCQGITRRCDFFFKWVTR